MLILRTICVKDRCAYFALGSILNGYVKVVWLAYFASESSRIHTCYWYVMIFEPARAWSLYHDVQSRDLLTELRAHYIVSGEADEPIWNELLKCELKWLKSYWSRARTKCYVRRPPLGPRGSKYFVREPPLEPSSRYLLELVGMLVPCLHKTWTTASQLTPYPLIAVLTWHLVMNVL